MDEWRDFLYPILGIAANLAFMSRVAIQWLKSEMENKSIVPPIFWQLSLLGSFLLGAHSILQLQYSVCLAQGINGVIAWRNLNLRKPPANQFSLPFVLLLFFLTIGFITSCFVVQGWFLYNHHFIWTRTPTFFAAEEVSLGWHIIGTIGVALFASRFWVQWYMSEMKGISYTGRTFWWISLSGAFLSSLYFFMILDLVNFIGPALGSIVYIRNLFLIQKYGKENLSTSS